MSIYAIGVIIGATAIFLLLREVALGLMDYREARSLKKYLEAQRED